MKYKIATIACLMITGLTVSCNNCRRQAVAEKDTPAMTVDTITPSEVAAGHAPESVATSDNSDSRPVVNSSNRKQSANRSQDSKADPSKSGYSAPDGTDAENNDGDQYTKNDNRRMPTGTAIK
jgi:hypothetical protein